MLHADNMCQPHLKSMIPPGVVSLVLLWCCRQTKVHLRPAHLHNKNTGVLEAVKQLPEDELVVVGDAVVHQGLSGAALDGLYQFYVLQVPAGGRHSFQVSNVQVH